MSIKLAEKEISRFLASSEPEVICIMGKWGAGKTFAWEKYLKDAVKNDKVALKKYSYVSLFGQDSLDDLKHSIFENTIDVKDVESGSSVETLKKSFLSILKSPRKLTALSTSIGALKDYLPGINTFFIFVERQIICIDDLERTGQNLEKNSVLGLASYLKERRGCKIVLLLNDEKLGSDHSKFREQLEKVADVDMRFEPLPDEAAEIGVDKKTSFHEKFSNTCISLGIVNIRIIRKIQRLITEFEKLVIGHDKRILDSAIASITIFGWSVYQKDLAPSLEYLAKFNRLGSLIRGKEEETEQEKKWRIILGSANFAYFDELDQLLLESVQLGYFDPEKIEKMAKELDKKYNMQDKDNSFHEAWQKYHNSFKNNEKDVLDGIYTAFKKSVQSVSPTNLDGTVELFRKFGRDKQADEMISYYMQKRQEGREFYDPRHSAFLRFNDPGVASAFVDKLKTFEDKREPKEVLIHIAKSSGWNPEDISILTNMSEDQYYELFKNTDGSDLSIIIGAALGFRRIQGASEEILAISSKAEGALERIGSECKINEERVRIYGITLDKNPDPDHKGE